MTEDNLIGEDLDVIFKPKKTKKKSYIALQDIELMVIDRQVSYKLGDIVNLPKKHIDVLIDRGYLEVN